MKVLFLDDDKDVLADGLSDLDLQSFEIVKCLSIDEAKQALLHVDGTLRGDDYIFFVDHDLGPGGTGYEFVEWVRRHHPIGHLLPIVYLTGRESERGFIEKQGRNPYHTPSLYLGKREFARTTFDINAFLRHLVSEYGVGRQEVEQQRLESTIRFFEDWSHDDV